MPLLLSTQQLTQIHHHLQSVYPQEGCGILLGTIKPDHILVHQVIETANIWNNTSETDRSKRDRYEIDPQDMLKAMKYARQNQLEIIGIYHSHPDHPAIPSECDRQLAWAQYIYLICSLDRGLISATTAWQLDDSQQFQPFPLISNEISSNIANH